MSATSVYNALNSYISSDKTIDLWAAANGSDDLRGMISVLGLFNITGTYPLNTVVLTASPNGTSVLLTGKGSFQGSLSYPVTASLQYLQGGNTFSLALAVDVDYVFSDFFNPLPGTLMQVPAIQQGITWYPSVLNGMTVRSAVFTGVSKAVNLQVKGFLLEPNNAYLLTKTPMIGPYPLRLSGTVAMPIASRPFPLIDVDARGNDTVINGVKQAGVSGPDAIALSNPGLNLLVQPLIPPRPGRIAFSTIELFANFNLLGISGRISTLILSTNDVWSFTVRFDKEGASLVQGLAQLTLFFGVELPVPMNFPILSDFYIAGIDIDLENTAEPGRFPSFSLLNVAITIQSDKVWNPPVPFVTLSNVGTRWVWGWTIVNGENMTQEKIYTMTGSVFGTINFGDEKGAFPLPPVPPVDAGPEGSMALLVQDDPVAAIDVIMSLPSFIISGSLVEDTYIPIGQALTYFFGNSGPSTGLQSMNITKLNFTADPIGQNYFAEAAILFGKPDNPDQQQGWEINLFLLTIVLNELEFNIAVNGGKVSGGISGTFFLQQGTQNYTMPRILLSAQYPPQNPAEPEGWTLSGYLYPGTSILLTDLVYQFIYGKNQQPPEWIPNISVDRLSVVFTTGSAKKGPSYVFGGTVSARWTPVIFDTTLKINASASVDVKKLASSNTASGQVTGMFSVNKISLTASLTFGVPEPTYLFKVQFDQLWLQATTSWRGETNNRHQVVSLQLGGVTLGDILEYLVNLAAPTIGFKLDSPWDVLKQVELSRFILTIDPKENTVEFVFKADVDLVIAHLDSIGVRYSKPGGEGKVDLILTGSFLGQQYPADKPLSWDVVNDPPPAVPGQGVSLVNLRYVGLGQRVTFKGDTPETVAASIKRLREQMGPPPDEGSPMPQTMEYAADSQWLIGLDLQIMETVDLGFIFNDPKLYGLSIGLGGEKAGSLAGLRFEILYKKITDDIGMFRVELQVPDMFRTIQLGVVSITLGIIVVEIYTNGNFKVDLGFPYNQDFSRSFSLQAYIFIGRGGFYLGVLNGDTSTQVPRISNGNFAPVIELGIGIAAGVGREIKAGILSGGAYVELQVIFQGVLAWFNPNSNGAAPATYFKCQGIAALHGKIYGAVDFVVVKVSVTLEAYAQVSLIYECYQPLQIALLVSVRAQASIKILFIRIHFSFSVKLEIAFTVGDAKPTPWILSNNAPAGGGKLSTNRPFEIQAGPARQRSGYLLRQNRSRRMDALRQAHYESVPQIKAMFFAAAGEASAYVLNWQPSAKVFSNSPRTAHLTLLPIFTIAGVPVNWDPNVPVNNSPDYRSAFVLFADTGASANAASAADCILRNSAHSGMTTDNDDTSLLAADIFTQGLSLYAINAVPRSAEQGNTITAAQIELLLAQLDLPQTMSSGLSIQNLSTFFATNINLWISGDIDPRPDEKSAMVIPMPPFIKWTSPQVGDVDFSHKNDIGAWYEWGISQLLNAYLPVGETTSARPQGDDPGSYESFTSFMFRDFCLLIIQSAVKEMQKHLNDTTVTVQTVSNVIQSLEEVAATLPKASVPYTVCSGDTVENVAETLGATVEELEFLNPNLVTQLQNEPVGTVLTIVLGIAPEILGLDNAEKAFAITSCTLGTLVHQAAQNQTLQNIATLFNVTGVAALLKYQNRAFPILSSAPNILLAGALINMPVRSFANAPADFTQTRTAAVFFVRYLSFSTLIKTPIPDMANWYAQAIAETNQDLLKGLFPDQRIPSEIELPPGQTLRVPNTYLAAYKTIANTNVYTTVAGDTLERIGFALVFQQDYTIINPPGVPQWQNFKNGVAAAGAQIWTIPAQTGIVIESGMNLEMLVRRFIIEASWTAANPQIPAVGAWTYNWDAVALWLANANVLMPLASVTVPDAATGPQTELSFAIISTTYGITVTDAATRLKTVHGLYASETALKVKSLPAQDIEVLIAAVLQGNSFASVVNQSSRMLMSGLQLPGLKEENGHVVPDAAHPLPLYDLTGQQFSIPVDKTQPTATALALSVFSKQSWIQLYNSITVQTGQTLGGLETTYPNLLTYNPGLTADNFRIGMVLLTGIATSLDYSYTNSDVINESPESGLSVVPIPATPAAPAIMPVSGTVPVTYGLAHRIELQTSQVLPIPQVAGQQQVTGNPGFYMFPAALMAKAESGVSTPYEILATQQGSEAGSKAIEIEQSTFGTVIPFKIKRLNDTLSQFNVIGVDTDKRGLLISLSKWLQAQGAGGSTKAYLMLSPSPDAANTSGLTVLTAVPANSFLIKTNLSTASVPPSQNARIFADKEVNTPVYYAALSSLAEFLVLLWEGSVVGGTGYYFDPGQVLPGSAFDQQGIITMQLLVIAGTQQAVVPDGRSLLPFNNCVLIGAGIDSSDSSLFVQHSGNESLVETITQALVPPGNIGFSLLTANPETLTSGTYTAKEILLKTFYSLLTFEVVQTLGSPFAAAASGMPVLPDPTDGVKQQAWQKERNLRRAKRLKLNTSAPTPLPYWDYTQVLPVSRFILAATKLAAANVDGLPAAGSDPYQGYGTQTTLPYANFKFGFGDVLGNRTGLNGTGEGTTSIPVGYTDNIITIGDWPSISRYFKVLPSGSGALLTTIISMRPSDFLPTPSQRGDVNKETIAQQKQQFGQIYFQFVQPGLTGWIVSSLKYVSDENFGNKGIQTDNISALWKFAAGAYALADSLHLFTAAKPALATTLGGIVSTYRIRYSELAQANADSYLQELFTSTLPVVPAYYPFVEYHSIAYLYTLAPAGSPLPVNAEALLGLPQNTSLLLKNGAKLAIPAKQVNSGSTAPTVSLQQLAADNHTVVEAIAKQNSTLPILQQGFEFIVQVDDDTEIIVTVDGQINSLQSVSTAFANEGVNITAFALADLHKTAAGMLAVNQSITVNVYVVSDGETLDTNNSGVNAATLAQGNAVTEDIFDQGALIYFGDFTGVTAGNTPVTLQQFADRYACPVELLLSNNPDLAFPATGSLVVPGTLAWPQDLSVIRIPYTIREDDTLNKISVNFNFNITSNPASQQLAIMNANMLGTIVPDISIQVTVGQTIYTVNTGQDQPSFASLLTALQQKVASATLQDVVNSIQATTGILNQGGLLLCPPALFTKITAAAEIKNLFGITPGAFALVNTAMLNLINNNITLKSPDGKKNITTAANDTFNSLITRFANEGISVSANEIVNANLTAALFKQSAIGLLSPADLSFQVNIGQGGPYEAPIVPLQTSLRILRPAALIYPDFKTAKGSGPVEMAESNFPAPTTENSTASGLNYNAFVTEMKAALPQLRLGTAQVNGIDQDLWVVNFDDNGIKEVKLTGATIVNGKAQPRFFALMPLYQHLVTRTIPVKSLGSNGELGASQMLSFQSIDVELWARRFVEDLDQFLTGNYAMSVYNLPAIREQLAIVLDAKNKLISAIASGLNTVLDIADPEKAAAMSSAEKALEQQLGVSLAKTYEASVLIQYNATVKSAWQQHSGLLPASLYGNGMITGQRGDAVPGLTMVAAKTDISAAASYVNFLMMLDNPAFHRDITGDFNYAIPNLEFNITDAGVPQNYQASNWLTFMPLQSGAEKPAALKGTDPGAVNVPVPLRNFPDLPTIIVQQAQQHATDGTQDVTKLALWDYDLVYAHQYASQDYVVITAQFNLTLPQTNLLRVADPRDLFTELAQYQDTANPLWKLLNGLVDTATKIPATDIANAVKTFAALATNISQYWTTRLPDTEVRTNPVDNMVAALEYRLKTRANYNHKEELESLTIVRLTNEPGPNNGWPLVFVQIADNNFSQLVMQTPVGNTAIYKVGDGVVIPASALRVFKLKWAGLNLSGIQNARSKMYVQRNQELIQQVQTNPLFIFSTEEVVAPGILTPLNTFGKRVDITLLGSNLTDALNACFTGLFGEGAYGQVVTMELGYGFELVPITDGDAGLVTYLPIGLYPNQTLSALTAANLNAIITNWQVANRPAQTGGEWTFSLKLYSQLTDNTHILMNIEHLIYRITPAEH